MEDLHEVLSHFKALYANEPIVERASIMKLFERLGFERKYISNSCVNPYIMVHKQKRLVGKVPMLVAEIEFEQFFNHPLCVPTVYMEVNILRDLEDFLVIQRMADLPRGAQGPSWAKQIQDQLTDKNSPYYLDISPDYYDIHSSNVGMFDGKIVFFDF